MKPGPRKRVFGRLTISLGKGQRHALNKLISGKDLTLAQVVRVAVGRVIANNGADLFGQTATGEPRHD
jgi:hypothetical protein